MASETIEVTGHIVDSLLLAKILDSILDAGCDYEITDVAIGKTSLDPSRARIDVTGDDEVLGRLVDELQVHGANRVANRRRDSHVPTPGMLNAPRTIAPSGRRNTSANDRDRKLRAIMPPGRATRSDSSTRAKASWRSQCCSVM